MRYLIGAALWAALFTSASAQDRPSLTFPVACTLGEDCFITALMDHDPGLYTTDFSCGTLTRDGHKGTDITLVDLKAMEAGVDVLAAAAGTVVGIRDRLPDTGEGYGDEDCGNGVALSHGGGWVTQYCHLKRGSITVAPGDTVSAGDPLGQVGRSGAATLPHLHLSVFLDEVPVDPFAPDTKGCGNGSAPLWESQVTAAPAGFLATGFATSAPTQAALREDASSTEALSATAPIIAWVSGYGSRPGDILSLSVTHPSGLFTEQTVTLDRRQETWLRFTGRRYTSTPWPQGPYTATFTLTRQGAVLAQSSTTAIVN